MSALRQALAFTLVIATSFALHAQQDYRDEFYRLFDSENWNAAEQLLTQWAESQPVDPELFVARFNFFRATAQQMGVGFAEQPEGDVHMELTDPQTGEAIGFMNLSTEYEPIRAAQAIATIINGISRYPRRLDMRLGKAYFHMEIGDFEGQATTLKDILRSQYLSSWTWSENEQLDDPHAVTISSVSSGSQLLSRWLPTTACS